MKIAIFLFLGYNFSSFQLQIIRPQLSWAEARRASAGNLVSRALARVNVKNFPGFCQKRRNESRCLCFLRDYFKYILSMLRPQLSWQSSCLLSKRSQVRILLGGAWRETKAIPGVLREAASRRPVRGKTAVAHLRKRSQVRILLGGLTKIERIKRSIFYHKIPHSTKSLPCLCLQSLHPLLRTLLCSRLPAWLSLETADRDKSPARPALTFH